MVRYGKGRGWMLVWFGLVLVEEGMKNQGKVGKGVNQTCWKADFWKIMRE